MLHFRMTMPLYLMMFSGSILLLIVLLLRCLLKKRLPGYVFPVLWGLVLVRFLVPFSLSSPLSLKLPSYPSLLQSEFTEVLVSAESLAYETEDTITENTALTAPPAESVSEEETVTYDAVDTPVIASYSYQITDSSPVFYINSFVHSLWPTVYLPGIILTAGILFLQKYRCSRKLKKSLLIEHNETVNSILHEMNMAHILVFSNDGIASPLVCGLLAPRIYLPARMDFRNTELLRHILAHETMHIKRRDNWLKAVMLTVLCLNWFNPLVWLMARCLSSDLETACDEAVLRTCQDEDARKGYAFSLLAMAVTAARSPLLYSAFSKTEVEKRIQRVLQYKRTSVLMLLTAFLLLTSSTVVFATGIQAPFDSYLSSTCYYGSSDSRWAFKVFLTRDIALGKDPGNRANDIILDILEADSGGDPELISERLKETLAEEFHVEKGAFDPVYTLCIDEDTEAQEYAAWELTRDEDGLFLYQGEKIHSFTDEMNRRYQSDENGSLDIVVQRNRLGFISSVTAYRDGVIVRLTSAPVETDS